MTNSFSTGLKLLSLMKRCGLGRDVETTPGMSGRISEPPVVAGSAVNITQGLDVIVCQSVSTLCTAVNLQQFTSPSQYALPSVFLKSRFETSTPSFFSRIFMELRISVGTANSVPTNSAAERLEAT